MDILDNIYREREDREHYITYIHIYRYHAYIYLYIHTVYKIQGPSAGAPPPASGPSAGGE